MIDDESIALSHELKSTEAAGRWPDDCRTLSESVRWCVAIASEGLRREGLFW